MKAIVRLGFSLILLLTFLLNTLPCGPGYVSPLFDTYSAPEDPYTDYAAGRLGIVKQTFHRSVLYAAYRYINGGGLNVAEQQAMMEVWRAEIDNKDYVDSSIDDAVKAWVDRRKQIVTGEEKPPEIYAERSYGGYEFFPNCTRNAFETATETLADRASAHGPSDPNVQDWIRGQDAVFENCSNGKKSPAAAPPGAPDWLQKDRAYQIAAAAFYSLDYRDARKRFAEIAQDTDSPWAETADYLVARTLIRQASLNKNAEKAAPLYDEAEQRLEKFNSRTGKFTSSAQKMLGLIKYRRHPKERVAELARALSGAGDDNFRQDVIDYNWLLDKFESEALTAEDKRKTDEKNKDLPLCTPAAIEANTPCKPTPDPSPTPNKHANELELNLYTNEKSYTIYVKEDATDDEAIAAAEKAVGIPLTDQQKEQVRSLRQSAYAARYNDSRQRDYEGGYYGEEKLTPSLLPVFLRQDELTTWLFVYQMPSAEAYLFALNQYKSTGSPLWLMTAISKADKASTDVSRLLQGADNTSSLSPAFATIAYHHARILLEQGKPAEARKIIDDMLGADTLPVSAHNSFLSLRLHVAETLDDFLRYSMKKPYAFDFDGETGTVEQFIAEQKSWWNPETFPDQTKEQYDAEVEKNFAEERLWQERQMFDDETIEVMNQLFPKTVLLEVERSPMLPEYMRERFAIAIWTRAYVLDDMATLLNITPELIRLRPEFEPLLTKITTAPTQPAKDTAALYFVLKNPVLTPYLENGLGKTNNDQDEWSSDDWWCGPYDTEYNETTGAEQPKALPARPSFLTAAQAKMAQAERNKLKEIGDAPKFLADRVMAWAKRAPADRRVPEAIYIMIHANGWTKYGCGNNEELKDDMTKYLKLHYPASEWTRKLAEEESGNQ